MSDINNLDALLNIVRINDLFDWLKVYAKKHPNFGKQLASYIEKEYISPGIGAGDYRTSVDAAFDEATDSNGYHDWINPTRLSANLDELFEEGERLLDLGNPFPVIEICLQALANLGKEVECIDDSDGEASDICEQAHELILKAIVHPALAADDVEAFVKELKENDNIAGLDDYGLCDRDDLLADIYRLTQPPEKRLSLLNELIAQHPDDYDTHTYVKQKIECLQQLDESEEVAKTISNFLHLPEIRTIAVDEAVAGCDYDKALLLINDGIALARERRHYGTERDWMKRKVEVHEAMGDTAQIIEATKELFLHERLAKEYYHRLKELVPAKGWHEYLYTILGNLPKGCQPGTDDLAYIYIEEGDTKSLFHLIVKGRNTHIRDLDNYAAHLSKDYSDKVLPIYDYKLRWRATQAKGRGDYEDIADSMRIMQQLEGGQEAVHALAEHFRATYKRRRAMMEIINEF